MRVQSGTLITRLNLLALSHTRASGLAEFSTGPNPVSPTAVISTRARVIVHSRGRSVHALIRFVFEYARATRHNTPPLPGNRVDGNCTNDGRRPYDTCDSPQRERPAAILLGHRVRRLVVLLKTARYYQTARWKRNRLHDVRRKTVPACDPFRPSCNQTLPAGEYTTTSNRQLRPTDGRAILQRETFRSTRRRVLLSTGSPSATRSVVQLRRRCSRTSLR